MSNNKYCEGPSEFEEKCLELMEIIKDKAAQELKAEFEQLREENAKMKDIVDNYNQKVEELEAEKKKYYLNKEALRSEITKEVKNIRLKNLLQDFQTTLYVVRNHGRSKPKCNKCDQNGFIHYLSPRGQEHRERCECQEPIPFYKVLESQCCEFRIESQEWQGQDRLVGFYTTGSLTTPYNYERAIGVDNKIYDGRDFTNIQDYHDVFFRVKDTAQKYADWLNERVEEENKKRN